MKRLRFKFCFVISFVFNFEGTLASLIEFLFGKIVSSDEGKAFRKVKEFSRRNN